MLLVVGLGNYGKEYERTPHNMGFLAVENLAKRLNLDFTKNKCKALVAEGVVGDEKIILAKPQTYMNLSGTSLREFVTKFKIPLENVIVISDDIDLPAGTIRYKAHGSGGTHNGLKNCVQELGTENFPRIRIGVGKPEFGDLADYVLAPIPSEKMKILEQGISQAVEKIQNYISKGKFID